MSVTGQQIRERIARRRREMAYLGQSTGGTSTTCVDTVNLRGDTLPADYFGADAWIRFTTGSNAGFVGKVDQVSGASGTITFSPAAVNAVVANDRYEIWRHGIRADEPDAARDRALISRCAMWRLKVLSVLTDVETWGAQGTGVGASTVLDFPNELFAASNVVTNAALNDGIKSESYYVQPQGSPGGLSSFRIFGDVSVHAGTGKIRVRDITNNADIALNGLAQFTLRGMQRFDCTFQVPAGCQEIQVWPTGAEANAVVEWAGVGLLPMNISRLNLQARVLSEAEVGRVYGWRGPQQNPHRPEYVRLPVERHRSAARVELIFGEVPGSVGAVYYMEQHHYAALQTEYLAQGDRTTGDTATTDCPLEYIEAATVVELLENVARDGALTQLYQTALKDLAFWDRKVGALPISVEEQEPATARLFTMGL